MELGTLNTKYYRNRGSQFSDERKTKLQRKGACFKCEKLGHRAKDRRSENVDKGKGRLTTNFGPVVAEERTSSETRGKNQNLKQVRLEGLNKNWLT